MMTRTVRVDQTRAGVRRVVIDFPYDDDDLRIVRALPGRRWDRQRTHWTVPFEHLSDAVAALKPVGFEIAASARRSLKLADQIQAENALALEKLADAAREEKKAARRLRAYERKHPGDVCFVPAGDARLTRRIKSAGIYRRVEAIVYDHHKSHIGLEVPDEIVVRRSRKWGAQLIQWIG